MHVTQQTKIIHGKKILVAQNWQDKAVVVQDGAITALIAPEQMQTYLPAQILELSEDQYLVPGFIDIHIHGAAGNDVMDACSEGMHLIAAALAREGVTSFLATTLSAPVPELTQVLDNVVKVSPQLPQLVGVHLEGPFLAATKHGAHDADYLIAPDIELLTKLQQQSSGLIKLLTIAPELPQAVPLIAASQALGINISLGHSAASYEVTLAAIEAGAKHATHLFNAMIGINQRAPGIAAACLLQDTIYTEVIADNIHLHPAILKLVYQLKGPDKIVLVTDAMRAKCLGNGKYTLGEQSVFVADGKATLVDGSLAGSTLTMPLAIKNFQQATGCTLAEAILMASANPARALGLVDVGEIAVGKKANLVVLDKYLEVQQTFLQGHDIYKAKEF